MRAGWHPVHPASGHSYQNGSALFPASLYEQAYVEVNRVRPPGAALLYKIVLVAHGIRFLTDDRLVNTPFVEDAALAERRANLKGRLLSLHKLHGVDLELCDITRSEAQLAEDKLYEGVTLVRSGVVRIAELQGDAYAYIKIE
jgi:intracellular sulfur oxidation DsrE/DsrF family protein